MALVLDQVLNFASSIWDQHGFHTNIVQTSNRPCCLLCVSANWPVGHASVLTGCGPCTSLAQGGTVCSQTFPLSLTEQLECYTVTHQRVFKQSIADIAVRRRRYNGSLRIYTPGSIMNQYRNTSF
jgi:hypothetical protein